MTDQSRYSPIRSLPFSFPSSQGNRSDYLESLRFPWEEGKEKGNDRIGEYRDWSVNYQSYDPVDWENPSSAEKEILNTKAYIDMPNIRAVSFLDPRDIFFGITVHF